MMLEHSLIRLLPLIAIPMIISMLIDSFYNTVDAYFVSQLGKAATSAVGINDSLSHFIRSVAMGFGFGSASCISRLMGAEREKEASCVATTALATAMLLVTALAVFAFFFVKAIVVLLGAPDSARQYSIDYARFILIAAPFTVGEVTLTQILRAEGSTRYAMAGMVSGCLINIVLDPVFIHVLDLEVAGAAIATLISKVIGLCILASPFVRKRTLLELGTRFFTPKWSIYKEIARMGLPTFLRSSMLSFSAAITNHVAGALSDSALAANAVAQRCTRLLSSAIMGFGQGFQSVAGYCWGAKYYRRTREAFWTCSAIGSAAALILGVVMFVLAVPLVGAFANGDSEIIAIGSLMIRSQCVTMVFHVWVIIVNGLFQSLGRGFIAGVLGLSRQMICLIPCVFVLSALFQVEGLALAQAASDCLCLCLAVPLVWRFTRETKCLETAQLWDNADAERPK